MFILTLCKNIVHLDFFKTVIKLIVKYWALLTLCVRHIDDIVKGEVMDQVMVDGCN